jgi:hypothetical protein
MFVVQYWSFRPRDGLVGHKVYGSKRCSRDCEVECASRSNNHHHRRFSYWHTHYFSHTVDKLQLAATQVVSLA